ncbi:BREX-3 system P-loop-containing protein BrxF [Sediminispirochaeta bajacaliforniensis]|uniref:BREX-3 system P-loop-containing protein BrxF n=1 Tax=Sediminispirochaeta bajacaliforniensis TaxID=148 RepID=UPI0012B594E1
MENLYYKISIIGSKYKTAFLTSIPAERAININALVCQEDYPASELNFEQIFSRNIDSKLNFICLYNFEILFRPEYRFDLLSFIKGKSKTKKFAIIWPGEIQNDQLVYSRPGRPDYYTHNIDNYLIYKEEQ